MKNLDDKPNFIQPALDVTPRVTIQIPLYNEKFVAARIIDCVAKFEYPIDKIQIQVLDDSTDESVDIVAERVQYYKNMGYDISHCLLYTSPSPRDGLLSRMPSSA